MTPGESDNPVARTFTLPREGEVIQHRGCNYHFGKYIGEGSWGAVFHCTDDWENELVAKILKPRYRTYGLLLGRIPTFTENDILNGGPRNMAEELKSVYSPAIGKALRRHVENRTQTALDFWKDISSARTK